MTSNKWFGSRSWADSQQTRVMWKLEEKLENDFTVREEILCSAGKGATCKKV